MANAPNNWACATATYSGHAVERCVLSDLPRISTIFMRLPDGRVMTLWDQSVSSLSRIDDSSTTYNRNDLSAALAAIMAEVTPTNLLTMDSTMSFGDDHPDHFASALFALEGARIYGQLDVLSIYRGYSSSLEVANLSTDQYNEKVRLMDLYEAGVPAGSDYDSWCRRQYSYPLDVVTGQLR
jgi:LmbE family N-acetylglucosaminyl deacetylase